MIFSIIIVNYNTKNLTKNCLDSIFSNCPESNFEIIVIDNNSQDGSDKMLESEFGEKIKLIVNKKNIGFGSANNQGARTAKGEYLFFLNSDTVMKSDILSAIKQFLDNNKEVGIISPQLLLEDRSEQERAYGKFPTPFSVVTEKFKNQKIKETKLLEADWVSGAALIIRKNIFDRINGFDEKFFMYFEDIDLCKRVNGLGYKIMVLKEIFITHLCGKSLNYYGKRKKYYYKSQDYFYKKHYGALAMNLIKIMRWPYKLLCDKANVNYK